MTLSALLLLVSLSPPPQGPPPVPTVPYVVSIINEEQGDAAVLRFVLSGPPSSYSATREGDEILVRIAAQPLTGLSLPAAREPVAALAMGSDPGFSLRVTLSQDRTHEMVREMSSLRLVLSRRPAPVAIATPTPLAQPDATAIPSPVPERTPNRPLEPAREETADLYRRLFPSSANPADAGVGRMEIGGKENWYSDFTWLGIQSRPWVSVSYMSGKTTQIESNSVSADSYWVVQPNLGLGISPRLGGGEEGEGQWKVNYTPRFRRQVNLDLPRLTSHFFDAGIDQPIASLGAVFASYHHSRGVLETEEVDAGREYGIGLNRVVDTSLERFKRNTFGFGVRFDFVADTEVDINAGKTSVRYGNSPEDAPFSFGERAFFDYDTRMLNASLRRGVGDGRFMSFLFGVHDTPAQKEREQVEGRGYSYSAAVEGDVVAQVTGRLLFGYRTQKSPKAGAGGQDYKDITYGAQLVREISEDTTIGLNGDRKLYLSAYEDNGFYIADGVKSDLNTRLPLGVFLRGNFGYQWNRYKASPQVNIDLVPTLRNDKIRTWAVGLARSFSEWAYLRVDYTSEYRDSNLDRFDIKTRAIVFQLGLGFFGKPGGKGAQPAW